MSFSSLLSKLDQFHTFSQKIGIKELDEYVSDNSHFNLIITDSIEELDFTINKFKDLNHEFKESGYYIIDEITLKHYDFKEIMKKLYENNTSLTLVLKANTSKVDVSHVSSFETIRKLSFIIHKKDKDWFILKSRHGHKGKMNFISFINNIFESRKKIFIINNNYEEEILMASLIASDLKSGKKVYYYQFLKEDSFLLDLANILLNKKKNNTYFLDKEKEQLNNYTSLLKKYDDSSVITEDDSLYIIDLNIFVEEYSFSKIKNVFNLYVTIQQNRYQSLSWSNTREFKLRNQTIEIDDNTTFYDLKRDNSNKLLISSKDSTVSLIFNTNNNIQSNIYCDIRKKEIDISDWKIIKRKNKYFILGESSSKEVDREVVSFNLDKGQLLAKGNCIVKLGDISKEFIDSLLSENKTLRDIELEIKENK